MDKIEKLEEELKTKEKLFDEKYVQNNANDCLSEEAEKMRKEIWQLSRRIDQMKEKCMKENSIEETIRIIERKIKEAKCYSDITGLYLTLDEELCNAFINILLDYKRVLKENEELKKEKQVLENTKANCPILNTSGAECKLKQIKEG